MIAQPDYTVQGLPGAAFEITTAEDIYTPDGTQRYIAGEVVDTVTSGEDRIVVSKPLYLGKFEIREVTVSTGMVVNNETHAVELTYAGQEIEITETSASVLNKRQKVAVTLEKAMEQNEAFGIGMNGEISAVSFGLYAAEDLPPPSMAASSPLTGWWKLCPSERTDWALSAPTFPWAATI